MKQSPVIYPLLPLSAVENRTLFVKGEGPYLYDIGGKRYLDANSGLWNVPFGYDRKELVDALMFQAQRLPYVNLITESTPATENYANELLKAMRGKFKRLLYTCSGSESVEAAIKIARKYQYLQGREDTNRVLVFDMSYHGTTYAAMTASGMDRDETREYAPLNGKISYLKTPFLPTKGNLNESERQVYIDNVVEQFKHHDVAAVLMEPTIASGGILQYPDWYLCVLQELMLQEKVLLLLDEVATGFGRTGGLFQFQHFFMQPDVICVSKAIDNGMIPMGAVAINAKVSDCFVSSGEYLNHFSTQCGNPIACAVAGETLKLLKKDTLQHIREQGNRLKGSLQLALSGLPCVREVRGRGLMLGIDLVDGARQPVSMEYLNRLRSGLARRGLLVYMFSTCGRTAGVTLMPPYLLDDSMAAYITESMFKCLSSMPA